MVPAAINLAGVTVDVIADKLESEGIVCLEKVVSEDWLKAARSAIPQHVANHGDSDFLVANPGDEPNTPSWEILSNPDLSNLLAGVSAVGHDGAGDLDQLQSGLAVRTGRAEPSSGNLFHYDSCVVTMVLPIVIPNGETGACGELVAIPNMRPFRHSLAAHAVDKLLTHNRRYRKRLARNAIEYPSKYIVELLPGNAYLFWGYRTFHGNLPCAAGVQRVTLVVQSGEVHRPSLGLSLARVVSRRRLRSVTAASADSARRMSRGSRP
jgi:hypothetical protein